jgi:hypothetical protein
MQLIMLFLLANLINAMPFVIYNTDTDTNTNSDCNGDENGDENDISDYSIPCYEVQNYYTNAIIVNHNVLYSRNITNSTTLETKRTMKIYDTQNDSNSIKTEKNITFYGVVQLDYKTLPHCSYSCDMLVIGNQRHQDYITTHFHKYFRIGGLLHMICNHTICTWGKLTCEPNPVRDEL